MNKWWLSPWRHSLIIVIKIYFLVSSFLHFLFKFSHCNLNIISVYTDIILYICIYNTISLSKIFEDKFCFIQFEILFIPQNNTMYAIRTKSKDWGQKEKRESKDEMTWWHCRWNEPELGQTLGDGEGHWGLACCSPWGHKLLDITGQLNNNKCNNCSPHPEKTHNKYIDISRIKMDLGVKPKFIKHRTVIVIKRWPKPQFFC